MFGSIRLVTRTLAVISILTVTVEALGSRFKVGGHTPAPFKARSPDIPAAHVLPLTRTSGVSKSANYLKSLRKGSAVDGVYGSTSLTSVQGGQTYLAGVDFGTQCFQAVFDTGSSDTWLVETNYQCVDEDTYEFKPESECAFGQPYSISKTFKQTPNENFNITYGDGQFLTGIIGTEQVTIAGITVKNQKVAVVDFAAWTGDGVASGLIGFAFPSLTSAYAGTNPTEDEKQIVYNPVFTKMYTEGYVPPVFSIAIERASSENAAPGGQLAIGGLPPVDYNSDFANAPFQLLTVTDAFAPTPVSTYQFYIIITNGFTYAESDNTNGSSNNFPNPFGPPSDPSQVQVIIDSGTTLIYLPTEISDAVNALFDPPAVFDSDQEAYAVDCSAQAPEFGVKIGSQTFFVNAIDMIIANDDGTCTSGVDNAGNGLPVLGDVFLRNVLAVFDIGASEMRFAAREDQ